MNNNVFSDENNFILNIEGFEGPIEVLLDLAKSQKVDLQYISILELADQYSDYVNKEIKTKNLTIVANFLVIAAWLAYLKSRLLLPEKDNEESPANTLAENLKEQLLKLEEMRKAGTEIFSRPQLDKDFYKKGSDNNLLIEKKYIFDCNLHDLLKNIISIDARKELKKFKINLKQVHTVEEAVKNLKKFLKENHSNWILLSSLMTNKHSDPLIKKSNIASHFAASLELEKTGEILLRQHAPFAPIYIKNKTKIK